MPPSSDQDSNFTPTDTKPNKVTQKPPGGGVQIPKSGKKNGTAKDSGGGGILAAVRKDAKMSNAKPSASPAKIQSQEIKPASTSANGNVNSVTSPLLDALSSASFTQSTSQNTNDWAENVPAFSTSPNNLINLGESPPTVPSSYEDRLASFGRTTREQRGIPNGHFQPASPPAPHRRRPLSYQMDGNFPQGFDDHRSQVSSYAARRSSMYSQQSRYGGPNPPLPHQTQAHFYGAPDADLLLSPPTPGLTPGENGYHCGFDSLSNSGGSAENVVVTGYEGGINLHAVTKRGLTKILNIDGLRGGVYNAKILPWSIPGGDFPLIALVIHGPVWSSNEDSNSDELPLSQNASMRDPASARTSPKIPGAQLRETDSVEYYQTTVEVYSLSTKKHVSTLISVPKTQLAIPIVSPLFKSPAPVGSLTIRADSGNIVVASGSTGEIWVFRQRDSNDTSSGFQCIGKVWTTIQHGTAVEPTHFNRQVDPDWHSPDRASGRKQYSASILSLNGRWLAYCPPNPSSQVSLRAIVSCGSSTVKVPGLKAFAPSQLPLVNCSVETPGGENAMITIAKETSQQIIKGVNYLGEQGVQVWKNYWSKPSQVQPPNGGVPYQPHSNIVHQFPPTHATSTQAPPMAKDPGLISVLDLEALFQHGSQYGSTPHPLGTFRVPHGCSFLSFSPNGLALFTASSKGDVQLVWDLMRLQYSKSSFLKGSPQAGAIPGPHVRQIAQFSRMTIARVVDVVWTSPHGERAAMVTEPGTVHILDLPASAFTWPPPRRKHPLPKVDEKPSEIASSALTAASGVASSAVNSLWTAARPLVGRRRRSSAGGSGLTVAAQAGHGTQALAAGISRSVGAATGRMNEMRKAGSTKLQVPRSTTIPSISCVLLLNGKRTDSVIVVGGGIVRLYTIKNRRADRPADKQKAFKGAKYVEYRLPSLPDFKFAPDPRELYLASDLELTEGDVDDSRFKSRNPSAPVPRSCGTESSIPQAEIESNAPYQPFHTDRRVSLHIYSHEPLNGSSLSSPSVSVLLAGNLAKNPKPAPLASSKGLWAFGGPIKTSKLNVGTPYNPDDDSDLSVDNRALPSSAIERVLRITDSTQDIEQIVITTRRRKGVSASGAAGGTDLSEEGFFENDCEVLDFASQRV